VSVATKVLCEAYKGVARVTLADRSGKQCIVYSLLTWETRAGRVSRSPASQVPVVASFFWSVWEAHLAKANRTVQCYFDAEANPCFVREPSPKVPHYSVRARQLIGAVTSKERTKRLRPC
jgi:hypothetical protein